jgi:hypothetical protein
MITPNKVVTLQSSALGMVGTILEKGPAPISLVKLYKAVSRQFESIDQFILAIDILYVLGRINVDMERKTLTYVG